MSSLAFSTQIFLGMGKGVSKASLYRLPSGFSETCQSKKIKLAGHGQRNEASARVLQVYIGWKVTQLSPPLLCLQVCDLPRVQYYYS